MPTSVVLVRRPLIIARQIIRFLVSMRPSPASNVIRPRSRGAKRRVTVFRVIARPMPTVALWARTVRNATTKAAGNRLASIITRRNTHSQVHTKRRAVAVVMWPEAMRAPQLIAFRVMRSTTPTLAISAHSASIVTIPEPGVAVDSITGRRVAFHFVALTKKRVVIPVIGSRRASGSFLSRARVAMRVTTFMQTASAKNVRLATLRRVGRKLPSITLRRRSFRLLGAHSKTECNSCHAGRATEEKDRAANCDSCHQRDDVHRGNLGKDCGDCHSADNAESFSEDVRFDHELTRFPLLGLHAIAACEACHMDHTFEQADLSCVSCHEAKDVHEKRLGSQCAQCHNPNGWDVWRFDHDVRSKFALHGAHSGLECSGCHRSPMSKTVRLAGDCVDCHSREDAHRGAFGRRCNDCHGEEAWKPASFGRSGGSKK